jgi:hypothetical protein
MKKRNLLALALFAITMMIAGIGCGGGGVVLESNNQPPAPATSTESVKNVVGLGSKNFEINLDFSTLPLGEKFCKGQKAPNDTWIDYPVSNEGKVTILNWPGGFFEFSFGTKDQTNVLHWIDPVGKYIYPIGVPKDQVHFRVLLE